VLDQTRLVHSEILARVVRDRVRLERCDERRDGSDDASDSSAERCDGCRVHYFAPGTMCVRLFSTAWI
jgi:hypothetical protein